MSLEQQIADLTAEAAALNATFQTKKQAIDAAVAAAVAAAPSLNRTYYVDAVNGDDTNAGTQAEPFATVQHAVESVPYGGRGSIILAAGQVHVIDADIGVVNKSIELLGDGGTPDQTTGTTTLRSTASVTSSNLNDLATFYCVNSYIGLKYIDIDLPARADPSLPWWTLGRVLFSPGEGGGVLNVKFRRGAITLRDDNALATTYGSLAAIGLVHAAISTPTATDAGYVVCDAIRGTASISHAGTVTLSNGAKMVDALITNPDGLHNVITNHGATVL